jgi:Mg/Co/Ni transporter MgtE
MQSEETILRHYLSHHPRQAAAALKQAGADGVVRFLESEPLDMAIAAVAALPAQDAASYLEKVDGRRTYEIVAGLNVNQQRDLLRLSNSNFSERLLREMPPRRAAALRTYLAAGKDTVGFYMHVPAVRPEGQRTVAEVIDAVRGEGRQSPSRMVVVDERGVPVGILQMRDLLFADSGVPVSSLIERDFPSFYVDEPVTLVRNHPGWRTHSLIPVVDRSGVLAGTISLSALHEAVSTGEGQNRDLLETGSALGELYRVGLTGFIQSLG